MSERIAITDNDYPERLSILQDLYAGNCSPQKAANAFASATLSDLSDLEGPLRLTWTTLIVSAREEPEHHEKLVEVLASIARLPDAENEEGEPLVVYDMQVWSDLPILGWELNYEWNGIISNYKMIDAQADVLSSTRLHGTRRTRFGARKGNSPLYPSQRVCRKPDGNASTRFQLCQLRLVDHGVCARDAASVRASWKPCIRFHSRGSSMDIHPRVANVSLG